MKTAISATAIKIQALSFLITILIPVAAMAYTEHSGTINSETWVAGTHYVTGNIILNNSQVLTIMPGAVVKFAPGTLMTIRGSLRAVGTAANLIVLTSMDDNAYGESISNSDGNPSRGDWGGIYLNGSGTQGIGEFDYCRIRYGGGDGNTSANVYYYYSDSGHFTDSISEESVNDGIRIYNCSPQINNSKFIDNLNDGLYTSGTGAATVTENIFTGNGRYGVYLNQASISPNFSRNTGNGNSTDGIVIAGTVVTNQSWSSEPGFPIVLLNTVTVNNNVELTVEAGTVIKFGSGVHLDVRGTLDANGSAENLIVFTSLKDDIFGGDTNGDNNNSHAASGDWAGIYLNGSGTQGIGEFDYCKIRYGGSGSTSANVYFYYSDSGHFTNSISEESVNDGIRIYNCSPQINNSKFIDNVNDGLYTSGSGAATITENIFTGNGRYGVYLNQSSISPNFSRNTGNGNSTDGIVIAGTVATNQSWSSEPGFPIVLLSTVTVNNNVELNVEAGTVVKFGSIVQLNVRGTLNATGSAENMVIFTSLKDDTYDGDTNGDDESSSAEPGDWAGIYLNGSGTQGIGEFDYCKIRYGGSGSTSANVYFYYSDSGHFTNSISEESVNDGIRIYNCSPQIYNSKFIDNVNDGLYTSGTGAATVTENIFTGNGRYGVYLNQSSISPNFSRNTGTGNSTDGIVIAGTVATNQSWSSEPGFPIVLLNTVTVNNNVELTVEAGTVVKFGYSVQLSVRGTLVANGTAGSQVVFTALGDDDYGGDTNRDDDTSSAARGDWGGINLNGSGTDGIGEFDYCRIRYGGGAGGGSANVHFYYSNSGHFTNSISEESAIDGIRIANCSPQIINSTFSKNVNHGLTISSGSPKITNCILWGNGGVEISGSTSVAYSDVQGGYAGEGNINKNPQFVDPVNGDYRLNVCSPAIDAGDPVENLADDYISGEHILSVDRVTAIAPGDPIWITDDENYESSIVDTTSATTITVTNGFFNSYAVANQAYLYTPTSNFTGEPAPNGRRINMGAYGGGSEAAPSLLCLADIEGDDGDVDGLDLREFMLAFGSSTGDDAFNPDADMNKDGTVDHNDLFMFAAEFGRTDCPVCP